MAEVKPTVATIISADCARAKEDIVRDPTPEEIAQLTAVVRGEGSATPLERRRAIYILGRIGRPEAVEPILSALPELDEGGQIAAADALGRLEGEGALRAVLRLSAAPEPQVRKFAAAALERKGGAAAVRRLRELVEKDPEPFVREAARRQIEKLR
jgi:HEAT repeat protein